MQSSGPLRVLSVDRCTIGQQDLHSFSLARVGCNMQKCSAACSYKRGTTSKEAPQALGIAVRRRLLRGTMETLQLMPSQAWTIVAEQKCMYAEGMRGAPFSHRRVTFGDWSGLGRRATMRVQGSVGAGLVGPSIFFSGPVVQDSWIRK